MVDKQRNPLPWTGCMFLSRRVPNETKAISVGPDEEALGGNNCLKISFGDTH